MDNGRHKLIIPGLSECYQVEMNMWQNSNSPFVRSRDTIVYSRDNVTSVTCLCHNLHRLRRSGEDQLYEVMVSWWTASPVSVQVFILKILWNSPPNIRVEVFLLRVRHWHHPGSLAPWVVGGWGWDPIKSPFYAGLRVVLHRLQILFGL